MPLASVTTCGPETWTSRCTLAGWVTAAPTPTASMRVPAALCRVGLLRPPGRPTGRRSSPRKVLKATVVPGGLKASPGWLRSMAVGSPSVTKTMRSLATSSARSRAWSQFVHCVLPLSRLPKLLGAC